MFSLKLSKSLFLFRQEKKLTLKNFSSLCTNNNAYNNSRSSISRVLLSTQASMPRSLSSLSLSLSQNTFHVLGKKFKDPKLIKSQTSSCCFVYYNYYFNTSHSKCSINLKSKLTIFFYCFICFSLIE
jgi:hypothetical protein